MTTSTGPIHYQGEIGTPQLNTCQVSQSMLLAAASESLLAVGLLALRVLAGVLLIWLVAVALPVSPQLEFYAALSAAVVLLYVANLADSRSFRDVLFFLVPGLLIWSMLAYALNPVTVGLSLFVHLMLAFFAGSSGISGSIRDLRLWPLLFGAMLAIQFAFVDTYVLDVL